MLQVGHMQGKQHLLKCQSRSGTVMMRLPPCALCKQQVRQHGLPPVQACRATQPTEPPMPQVRSACTLHAVSAQCAKRNLNPEVTACSLGCVLRIRGAPGSTPYW